MEDFRKRMENAIKNRKDKHNVTIQVTEVTTDSLISLRNSIKDDFGELISFGINLKGMLVGVAEDKEKHFYYVYLDENKKMCFSQNTHQYFLLSNYQSIFYPLIWVRDHNMDELKRTIVAEMQLYKNQFTFILGF